MRIIFSFLILLTSIYAGEGGIPASGATDPFAGTDYVRAFNHRVFKPFRDVLERDGTIANMPDDFEDEPIPRASGYQAVPTDVSDATYAIRQQLLTQTLITALAKQKRDAVLKPVYEAGVTLGFQGTCTAALLSIMPLDSMGGGFGLFALMNIIAWVARDAGKAVYTYWRPGNDPYARWEKQFAERMPYITHELWPQIIDTFGAARLGKLSYVRATDFFDIAFNLPAMHSFPYRPPVSIQQLPAKIRIINEFTARFFADYEGSDASRVALQASTRTYLKKLAYNEDGFVCVHLEGPGGVGETHYMKVLAAKMSEVLETDIPFEEINIRSIESSELEGDKDIPGQVLEALSRIAKKGKSYGVLLFDEAAWLNGPLKEAAKKMFEPNLGSFRARYLDSLNLSLKGFLVAFLSNVAVEDQALKSRMANVIFPNLRKDRLKDMALATLDKHLTGTGLRCEDVAGAEEITRAIEAAKTMRDVEIFFPMAIEKFLDRPGVSG